MKRKEKNKLKKNIAMVLILAMMLTIMPITVFAEATDGIPRSTEDFGAEVHYTVNAEEAGLFDLRADVTSGSHLITTPSLLEVKWIVGDQEGNYSATGIQSENEATEFYAQQRAVELTPGTTVTALFRYDNIDFPAATVTVEVVAVGDVAEVNGTTYQTLDQAIEAVGEADTIQLLRDATLTVGTIQKPVTINGNAHTVTVPIQQTDSGALQIYNPLTFRNTKVAFTKPALGNEKDWSAGINSAGELNLLEGTECSFKYVGIYANAGAQINVDASTMELSDMVYTCIMGEAGANGDLPTLKVLNGSTFTISNPVKINGITGFDIYVDAATFSVNNCKRQGLVKANLTLTNGATADLSRNYTGYNMYANNSLTVNEGTRLEINDCGSRALMTQGNAPTTIIVKSGGTFIAKRNGGAWKASDAEEQYYAQKSAITIGVYGWYAKWNRILLYKNDVVTFEDGATVDISDNYVRGLSNFGTIYIGNTTKITNNGALDAGETEAERRVAAGGGVYNGNSMTIADGVSLYNNHANTTADDIYNEEGASITFGKTGTDWVLDGEPDCTDEIDGWYVDGEGNRWNAHSESFHVELLALDGATTLTTLQALKAAHGLTWIINKVDNAGQRITAAPAEFVLINEAGAFYQRQADGTIGWVETQADATILTTSNGFVAVKNLEEGTYRIQEITAPTGYQLAETVLDVMVSYENGLSSVDFTNVPIPAPAPVPDPTPTPDPIPDPTPDPTPGGTTDSDNYDGPYSDDPTSSTEIPNGEIPTTDQPNMEIPVIIDNAEEEFPEEDVPLVDAPETVIEPESIEMEDPEIPLAEAPRTGDATPIAGFAGLLLAAGFGLLTVRRKLS